MAIKFVITKEKGETIKHYKTTIKGKQLVGETVVKIAVATNTGKNYPYNSIKRDKSRDTIITI